MNGNPDTDAPVRRSLSVSQWRRMALEGDRLPVVITLEGESMRPLIRRGRDRVTILPLTREIRIGDVVLFQAAPDLYVVHRVFRIKDGLIRTLGDNCENIWGLVVRLERCGRSWNLDTGAWRAWGRFWMAIHPARVLYKRGRKLLGRCRRSLFRDRAA